MNRDFIAALNVWIFQADEVNLEAESQHAEGRVERARRTFVQWATALFLSLWGIGIVGALASYLRPPHAPRSAGREVVSGGNADSLAPGSARLIRHGNSPVFVVRLKNGELGAVSAVCTHYHCVLKWDVTNQTFNCPCHDGTFGALGEVMSGLPRSSLRTYDVEIRRGEIQVRV